MDVIDNIAEVANWLDGIDVCRVGQGQQRRIALGSRIGGTEQAVFAVHGHRPHCAFGMVIVYWRGADGEIALKTRPELAGIGDRPTDAGLWQHLWIRSPGVQLRFNALEDRLGSRRADEDPLRWRGCADLIFDGIELGDEWQHDAPARHIRTFMELPPDMGPAEERDDVLAGEQGAMARVGIAHDRTAVVFQQLGDPASFAGRGIEVGGASSGRNCPDATLLADPAVIDQAAVDAVIDAYGRAGEDLVEYRISHALEEGRQGDVPPAELGARDMDAQAQGTLLLAVGWQVIDDSIDGRLDQEGIADLAALDHRRRGEGLSGANAPRQLQLDDRAFDALDMQVELAHMPALDGRGSDLVKAQGMTQSRMVSGRHIGAVTPLDIRRQRLASARLRRTATTATGGAGCGSAASIRPLRGRGGRCLSGGDQLRPRAILDAIGRERHDVLLLAQGGQDLRDVGGISAQALAGGGEFTAQERPQPFIAAREGAHQAGQLALGVGMLAAGEVELGADARQFGAQGRGLSPCLISLAACHCLLMGEAMDRFAQLPDLACLAEHHGLEGANATVLGSAHRLMHYGVGAAESRGMADFFVSMSGCNG